MKEGIRSRLTDSVESALSAADGNVTIVTVPREGEPAEIKFSQSYACEEHNISFGELEPRMFLQQSIRRLPSLRGTGGN